MTRNRYTLKLPASIKKAAAELATRDEFSSNQFITAAVGENVRYPRTAREFLRERAGTAKSKEILKHLRRVPDVPSTAEDKL